jgi:hypothetical protein
VPDNSNRVAECRRFATEARRMADAARTPAEKADLLQVERRWLSLARSYEAKIRAPSQRKPHRKGRAKD